MNFKSKIEAYSYTLLTLYRIREQIALWQPQSDQLQLAKIDWYISGLRKAIENHQQNPRVVTRYINKLAEQLSNPEHCAILKQLTKDIKRSDFQQTLEEKFENPLSRRLESELAIHLLQNPTDAIMEAVGRLSSKLIEHMDDLNARDQMSRYLKRFSLQTKCHHIFGARMLPYLVEIKRILTANDPQELLNIMFIHYVFAQTIIRNDPIRCAPVRVPVGKLKEIIEKYYPSIAAEEFFSLVISDDSLRGEIHRHFISDTVIYYSDLYLAIDKKKGRKNQRNPKNYTHQMGLMLPEQHHEEKDLPQLPALWSPDCKNQIPDFTSAYVMDAINNDTVYVSGPSGMTSVLLGQMEMLGNFESEALKKHYLTAIASYIVSGGYHSWHEVLGPAQFCLDLIPGYKVQVPTNEVLAKPPNYNQFFKQQSAIDPQFKSRRQTAWHNYLHYFNQTYLSQNKETNYKPIPDTLRKAIIADLGKYLHKVRSHQPLNFMKIHQKSIKNRALVEAVRDKIIKARYSDINELKQFLYETSAQIDFSLDTQLQRCFDRINTLIKEQGLPNPSEPWPDGIDYPI